MKDFYHGQVDFASRIWKCEVRPSTRFKQYCVDEGAEYFAISVRTVYRLIDEGNLGAKRSGVVSGYRCRKSRGMKRN
ncbi:MAG: excisionase family DNA-binding protein [Deltaproteobacteria bacterium]|nr:excisionase family DNA-binding protein [Deltaproteobacteria bacterium]